MLAQKNRTNPTKQEIQQEKKKKYEKKISRTPIKGHNWCIFHLSSKDNPANMEAGGLERGPGAER
jgi:hypothetical protein